MLEADDETPCHLGPRGNGATLAARRQGKSLPVYATRGGKRPDYFEVFFSMLPGSPIHMNSFRGSDSNPPRTRPGHAARLLAKSNLDFFSRDC